MAAIKRKRTILFVDARLQFTRCCALAALKDNPVEDGLICTLSVVECCQLDFFAHKVNPYLNTVKEVFHHGYHWCVDQCEYATDVMFKSREALEDLYPSLVGHAFYDFQCTDVFSFLGHKLDPKEFKVYKDVNHRDGTTSKRWGPMGKSISNLYRYAEISKAANRRFLDSLCHFIPIQSIEKEINGICGKKVVRGRPYTGYNVWAPETFQLFETRSDGKYLIRGFTNQEIRRAMLRSNPDTPKERGRMSRTLAKLRAHGLIRKIPHSRRYLVSDKGRRVLGALIETKQKIYPELAADQA